MEIEWYSTSTYKINYKYFYVNNFLINLEKLKINNYAEINITNE
jgi:hypothetical protein